ncbi:MAG: class I SAM-dependent methyltransferase [Nanoarchaeota archaeon]|nr:class I SAM-dependent methyltransferase [Nanoarchaeota archaeon]MBU0977394.1 class I SAM-dependent methyltransferase [Nanoarchaeota archaeon]
MVEDHNKISHTAAMCARARAKYTDMPYAQKIAAQIKDADGKIPWPVRMLTSLMPGRLAQVTLLEGRYVATNEALERSNYQILEVAAGLSPRGLTHSDRGTFYVETDLPEMIRAKEEIVKTIRQEEGRGISPNHLFRELNVLDEDSLSRIGDLFASQGNGRPIAVIHEGLLMYLSREEQNRMRDNLAQFFRIYSPKGVWISPDLSYKPAGNEGLIVKWAKRRIEKRTGRKFTSFPSPEEAARFLEEGGFQGDVLSNEHLVKDLTSVRGGRVSIKKAREVASRYRVCVARLSA